MTVIPIQQSLARIVRPAFRTVPPGRPRSVGMSMLLFLATLGCYGAVWAYLVHDELRADTGRGAGGVAGLCLFLAFPVLAFTLPARLRRECRARALPATVCPHTGLLVLLPVVGWVAWFVAIQQALNEYWWGR
jgi:hypothetical protein